MLTQLHVRPKAMSGTQDRAAWTGATINYCTDGLHVLSPTEVSEIDAALAHL